MATQITVKSPNGDNALYDVSTTDLINVQKGDYVFVPELATSLKMQIIDGSLSMTFSDGKKVLIQNIVNLITENSGEIINGLMDKLEITAIAFMNENGEYEEISFFEKLLTMLEEAAAGNKVNNLNFVFDENATPDELKTTIEELQSNDRERTGREEVAFESKNNSNNAPTVAAKSDAVLEDESINGKVIFSDSDGTATISISNGSVAPAGFTIAPDGTYTFDASSYDYLSEGEKEVISIPLTVTDNEGLTSTTILTISVTGTNDAPTLTVESTKTVDEDGSTTITFSANDVDGTVSTTATALHGTVTVNDDGTITYTPDANYNGADTITVTTTDDDGAVVTQTSSITVNDVNDAPTLTVESTKTVDEDGSTTITFSANDVDGTVSTTATALHGTVTVNDDGTITYTPDANYNGADTITVTTTDDDGAVVTQTSSITVTSDGLTLNPTADIVDASDTGVSSTDNITSDNTPTITGTTENGATVTITDKDGNVVGTTTADENGNYSITTSQLSDGTQDLTITTTDTSGNVASTTQTITVDTSAEAGTVTVGTIASDDIINASESNQATMTVSGTANGGDIAEGDSVTVTVNGTDYTTKVDANGNYSVDVATSDLVADNSIDVSVTSSDAAGNTVESTASKSISVDTSATITVSTEFVTSNEETFNYDSDGARNANNENYNSLEEAIAGQNGENHDNGNLVYKNVNNTSWNINGETDDTFVVAGNANNANINLGNGDNKVVFETNPGHNVNINVGNGSDLLVLPGDMNDYDFSALNNNNGVFSGQITGPDNMSITINNFDTILFGDSNYMGDESLIPQIITDTVQITGTTTDIEAGQTINITVTDNQGNEVTTTATVQADGTYSANVDGSSFVDGNISTSVSVVDLAGNVATATDDLSVDTTTSITADISDASDTGVSATDNITSDNTPTITGTTESGATVTIYDANGNSVGTTTADENGNYSITTSQLSDGTQNLTITTTDTSGNVASTIQTITVDTATSDISALAITDIVDNTGDYSSVTMKGTGAEAGNTISIFDEDGNVVGTAIVQENGTWSADISDLSATGINDNEFFKVSETDTAGNETAQTDSTHYWHGTWANAETEVTDDFAIMGDANDTITINDNDANDKVVIDGGAGTDKAIFNLASTDVTITTENGNIIVTENNGSNDINELRNVETIQFTDGIYDVETANFIPNVEDDSVTTNEDTALVLSVNDFGYSDIDGDSMSAVQVVTLPVAGVLTLNGIEVSAGDEISASDISSGNLVFTPTSNSDTNVSFDFKVSDGTSWSEVATTTINVEAVADTPLNVSIDVSRTDANIVIDGDTNVIENDDTSNVSTVGGVSYNLSFSYTGNETVNVYYGDQLVGTVDGANTSDSTHNFDISGLPESAALTFKDENGDPISGITDTYIAPVETMIEYNVDVSAMLSDTDGSESLSITLSGLPTGATLEVGVPGEVAGTWVISTENNSIDLSGVHMYIPESADDFTITATATATDANGDTATASASSTVEDIILNTAATSTDDSVTAVEDTTLVLSKNDFGTFNDIDGNSFVSIKLSSLPENGTLKLLGQDNPDTADGSIILKAGDEVTVSDMNLGNLVFIPNANSDATGSFDFRVGDGYSFSEDSYTTTVNIEAVADAPVITMEIGTPTVVEGTSSTFSITDNFTNSTDGWSNGSNTSSSEVFESSDNLFIKDGGGDGGSNATKTFTGLPANSEVEIVFDVKTFANNDNWETNDYIGISFNNNPLQDVNFSTNQNNTIQNSFTAMTDEHGNLTVVINSNTSSSGELARIDNFTISGGVDSPASNVYPIDIETTLGADKDESLGDVTLSGIPSEATIYANGVEVAVTNGEVQLSQAQISAGNITMSIPQSASQSFELSASVTSTDGNDTATTTATVEHIVADDAPIAIDETATVDVEVTQNNGTPTTQIDTNIVMVLDLSGSMSWDGDNSQAGVQSRLDIAKNAIEEMINAYDNLGDVNVKLTTFSSTGAVSSWMSASDAIDTINNLRAGGATNYEDALYKTYSNYDSNTAPVANKTVGFFISDGEPTKENTEGRDVRGNVGQDAENGWIDSAYETAWTNFVNDNLNELNVVGIGTGITNTTYLDQLAHGINSNVKVNTMVVKDVTELEEYIAPKINVVEGTIADNIDYGNDGVGGITSIVVDGITYTSANFPDIGLTTNSGGKLEFDFDTGNYKYSTASTVAEDYQESFEVTVADADGDTATMNLNINIDYDSTATLTDINGTSGDDVIAGTSADENINAGAGDDTITFEINDTVDGGVGTDTLVFEENTILDFDSLAAKNIEIVNIENNNQLDSSTLDVQDVINVTDDDNILRIIGDAGDEIGLTNDSGDTVWEKSDTTVEEGDDTFEVWTNDNVTVYIDTDITVTDI